MASQTFVLGNCGEKDVLQIRAYLHEENVLLFYYALYALGVRCSLVSFIYEISFHLHVLYVIYNGNLFDDVTLKGVFNVLVKT